MASMRFFLGDIATADAPLAQITIVENANGTVTLTVSHDGFGDLRGLFFDFADESVLQTLSVTNAAKTLAGGDSVAVSQPAWMSGDDSVRSVGSGSNNMNGFLGRDGGYDF